MKSKIREFLIIPNQQDIHNFKALLWNESQLGFSITYKIQKRTDIIAQALIIGEKFIENSLLALSL